MAEQKSGSLGRWVAQGVTSYAVMLGAWVAALNGSRVGFFAVILLTALGALRFGAAVARAVFGPEKSQ